MVNSFSMQAVVTFLEVESNSMLPAEIWLQLCYNTYQLPATTQGNQGRLSCLVWHRAAGKTQSSIL